MIMKMLYHKNLTIVRVVINNLEEVKEEEDKAEVEGKKIENNQDLWNQIMIEGLLKNKNREPISLKVMKVTHKGDSGEGKVEEVEVKMTEININLKNKIVKEDKMTDMPIKQGQI